MTWSLKFSLQSAPFLFSWAAAETSPLVDSGIPSLFFGCYELCSSTFGSLCFITTWLGSLGIETDPLWGGEAVGVTSLVLGTPLRSLGGGAN